MKNYCLSISEKDLFNILVKQISSNFILDKNEIIVLEKYYKKVLEKTIGCIKKNKSKYFSKQGLPYFNPFHSVQYMIFLYYYSNTLYTAKEAAILCDKIYYLNKIMNSVDIFYAIELPSYFCAEHPIGTVLGRAKYEEGFFFYQGCTIGGYHEKNGNISYPTIKKNVYMYANSSIIGRCVIGANTNIGPDALVKNCDIPSDCNVFGQSPNLIIKMKKNGI